MPPTRIAFEHLATAIVAEHLMGQVRLATLAMYATYHTYASPGGAKQFKAFPVSNINSKTNFLSINF